MVAVPANNAAILTKAPYPIAIHGIVCSCSGLRWTKTRADFRSRVHLTVTLLLRVHRNDTTRVRRRVQSDLCHRSPYRGKWLERVLETPGVAWARGESQRATAH